MQAFLPLLGTDLTLKGKPGKILNMSSIYGSYTLPFCVSYHTHLFNLFIVVCLSTEALPQSTCPPFLILPQFQ